MASSPSKAVLVGVAAAKDVRLEHGLGIEPLTELWSFIRSLDIDLAFHEFGADGADGIYYWDGRRALIVVNSSDREISRQRFTAAHELGHHILHGGTAGSALEVVDGDVFRTGGETKELEANAFASDLLLPAAAMRVALPGKPRSEVTAEDVVDLMHRFGTSFKATLYRLHNTGRILAADRDRIDDEGIGQVRWLMQAKGYDREDLRPGEPLPAWYSLQVLEMCRVGSIDVTRAAELLRRDASEVTQVLKAVDDDVAIDPEMRDLLGDDFDEFIASTSTGDEDSSA